MLNITASMVWTYALTSPWPALSRARFCVQACARACGRFQQVFSQVDDLTPHDGHAGAAHSGSGPAAVVNLT